MFARIMPLMVVVGLVWALGGAAFGQDCCQCMNFVPEEWACSDVPDEITCLEYGTGWDLCTFHPGFVCVDSECLPSVEADLVEIVQISYESDDTGLVPFSEYGQVTIVYLPPPFFLQLFLSIIVDTGTGSVPLLTDMPILGADIVGVEPMEVTALVDLGVLGINRGDAMTGLPITYQIGVAEDPGQPPVVQPDVWTIDLGSAVHDFGGLAAAEDTGGGSLEPAINRPDKVPYDGDPAKEWVWRWGIDNHNVGHNQCTPASMTNSFHWLRDTYPHLGILAGQTWYQTLAKFKADLGTTVEDGTLWMNVVPGKLKFLQRSDKGFGRGWQVKYQGDTSISGLTTFPDYFQEGRLVARRVGGAVKPTFDFIMSELMAGEDVEVHVGWRRPDGTRNGGHSLVVVGALRHGNKQFIWTADDGDQDPPGHKPSDTNPASDGGLRPAHLSQVLVDDDGFMHLDGLAPNGVELVTSESPPDPTKPLVLDWVYSDGVALFGPSVWTRDGRRIGKTFPDGVLLAPGEARMDWAILPEEPNDWHWWVQLFDVAGAPRLNVDMTGFAPGDDIGVEVVFCEGHGPVVTLIVDHEVGLYSLADEDGVAFHVGLWSDYPGDLPPECFPTGLTRGPEPAGVTPCESDLECVFADDNCCTWNSCGRDMPGLCDPPIVNMFGDVCGADFGDPPNGAVNLTDVLCALNAFGLDNLVHCPNADVAVVTPSECPAGNQVVNLTDLLKVLDAFGAPSSPTAISFCACPDDFR